jgi:hypothetical protein
MKYNLNSQLHTGTVAITKALVNEQNIWPTCAMLKEVTTVNDNLIMLILGQLNYTDVSVLRYHIDFHAAATLGDTMKIESRYTRTGDNNLHINVTIFKNKGRNKILSLTGDFTFAIKQQNELQQALADCA